jgi:hypothetical protein
MTQHRLLPWACMRERGRRAPARVCGGGAHRGVARWSRRGAGVTIGGGGDGEVAGARKREGGRLAGGLGRGGLRLAPGIAGDGDGQHFLQETEGQVS